MVNMYIQRSKKIHYNERPNSLQAFCAVLYLACIEYSVAAVKGFHVLYHRVVFPRSMSQCSYH